jgi:hypothetical protein
VISAGERHRWLQGGDVRSGGVNTYHVNCIFSRANPMASGCKKQQTARHQALSPTVLDVSSS